MCILVLLFHSGLCIGLTSTLVLPIVARCKRRAVWLVARKVEFQRHYGSPPNTNVHWMVLFMLRWPPSHFLTKTEENVQFYGSEREV